MIIISFNPILLSKDEKLLSWLDPEKLDISVIDEKLKIKTLSITYPIAEKSKETRSLFKMGNKIWIPEYNGLKACLYVISSDYNLDYWEKNIISVDCEEVLVELNFTDLFTDTSTNTITVNRTRLEEWFGKYFNIGTVDPCLNSNLCVISIPGTMTKMQLLRYIEEETNNVFITRYEKDPNNNTIHRYLDFLRHDNAGEKHDLVIDLGYSANNIEYEVDESDTYRAIAPILSLSESNDTNNSTTNNSALTREQLTKVINDWKNLAVSKGQVIPMIVEKSTETDPNTNESKEIIVYTANWAAPFKKEAGKMYVTDDISTGAEYNEILTRPDNEPVEKTPKIGTVSTSNTDKYAIYNDCATTLIEKRYPSIVINSSIKDLQQIWENKGSYNVYDTANIKIPLGDRLLPIMVTKTEKNPHSVGENKITLSNPDLGTKIVQKETVITASDMEITGSKKYFEAKLTSEGELLANKMCSITVIKPETEQTVNTTVKNVSEEKWSKYGVSADGTQIMSVGRPSASGELSKYGYKFYKTIFKRKCPFCGSKELYWGIFWAGSETKNWGVFPATGKREAGSAEGHIFCKSCDADFSAIDGKDHMSPPRKKLTKVTSSTPTTKQEAYNLKNGKVGTTTTVKSNQTTTEKVAGFTTIYNSKTDSNGVFKLQINFKKGEYEIRCNFGGDIEYGRSSKTVKLIVK